MKSRAEMIRNYINAYNNFDIDGMVTDLDENIKFVNVSDGNVDMTLKGLNAFREQAVQAKNLFSKRTQEIKSILHKEEETEILIDYHGVLATDLPNGLKKGTELNLQGRSVFKFSVDKIVELTDIS
ncbi:nuclear transport factor 2 family protein [Flavihumibacter sp. R14]|nr:nuclear transport factor 2 family protein [Flavihumibacter soli]